jgi:hypothetical protein
MELKQQKGKQWDKLSIADGRIHHEWSLSRESGNRSTLIENLDTKIGFQAKMTEGKAPYLVLAAISAGLIYFSTMGDGIGLVVWVMLPTLLVFFLFMAFRIESKEEVSVLSLRDGSVFAVIRHDWVDASKREQFFEVLKTEASR